MSNTGMRAYEELKDISIPKEQEEMMNIICNAWTECKSTENCGDCPDRQKDFISVMSCVSLKYTRLLLENDYHKQVTGEWETIPDYSKALTTYRHICSVCKTFYKDIRPHGHKYCHECGAKMKGGAE